MIKLKDIWTPRKLTREQLRIIFKSVPPKLEMNGILGPEVVPDEPGRAAGPAWPAGLAWPPGGLPWLAWLAICPAGSGRQQQRGRPPAPITAGGLFVST